MAASVETTQNQTTGGRRRYRNRGQKKAGSDTTQNNTPSSDIVQQTVEENGTVSTAEETVNSSDETDICFICAEKVKYYSVSECNHRTCHVCALRLRALYKKKECTFCNLEHARMELIFTVSPTTQYEDYNTNEMNYKDSKLFIVFETQEIMEESLVFLRFNCPDEECVFVAKGWNDLKMHARASHGKLLCDLCIRFKKVFAHEHALYNSAQLRVHVPSMVQRPSKAAPRETNVSEGGIHPLCEFCRECLFGDDELFKHMREAHEDCFICKGQGIRDQYFQNYESLERHFNTAHYPCKQTACQAQKFVVFGSLMDLKAHMVDAHGAHMSARDMKDTRRIEIDFDNNRSGPGNRRDRDRFRGHDPGRESQRDPPAASSQPRQPDRRRGAFGAALTDDISQTPEVSPVVHQEHSESLTQAANDTDPETAQRHAAFMARVAGLTSNSSSAATVVRLAVRSYRASESAARDLISTVYNLVDRDLEATASLIVPLVDLLDSEEKKRDLLAAYNGFKIEQREQFPDLVPQANNTSAVDGLALKHSIAPRPSRNGQVWERVARAATATAPSSNTAGPSIQRLQSRTAPSVASASSPAPQPMFRQPQRSTPWAASGTSPAPVGQRIAPQTTTRTTSSAPRLSTTAFPSLPKAPSRGKVPVSGNQSLRNIVGNNTPAVNAWTPNTDSTELVAGEAQETEDTAHQAKKGKKKGKEKITLFTLGSFPT